MRKLAIIFAIAALGIVAGCSSEGEVGDLCDVDEDCNSGLVCISQVYNCEGEDCWGSCERECVNASDCEGGDTCIWVRTARICRSAEYEMP